MSDAQLTELKAFFITVLDEKLDQKLDEKLDAKFAVFEAQMHKEIDLLRQEMYSGFRSIAEIFDRHTDQLDNHEHRISRLGSKIA
jgi:hypothetical protein